MRCVCNGGVQRVRREGSLSVWLSWIGSRCAHGEAAQKGIQRMSLLSGPYLKLLHLFQHRCAGNDEKRKSGYNPILSLSPVPHTEMQVLTAQLLQVNSCLPFTHRACLCLFFTERGEGHWISPLQQSDSENPKPRPCPRCLSGQRVQASVTPLRVPQKPEEGRPSIHPFSQSQAIVQKKHWRLREIEEKEL